MRTIQNKTYFLSRETLLSAGLHYETGWLLHPRIALISNGEKVIFSVQDWHLFLSQQNHIALYFLGTVSNNNASSLYLPDHEMLFTNASYINEREIVLKSKSTYMTVRLNDKEYGKIIEFSKCIEIHIKEIESKVDFANYQMQNIIEKIVQKLGKTLDKSYELYSTCCETQIAVPNPPRISSSEIYQELKDFENQDLICLELISVYSNFFVQEIDLRLQQIFAPVQKFIETPYGYSVCSDVKEKGGDSNRKK